MSTVLRVTQRCPLAGPTARAATYAIFAFFAPAALAQVNCEAIPAGPARTDCYIGLARVGGGNAAIAGTKSQLATDSGILRQTTGQGVKKKSPRKKSARRTPQN
ncbi:MAG TPA: hypothetical protein VM867_00195 [Xanthobacteraceae bacterium]|nr:hypothetical protein [Xanthobacteraceae bacterium]